MLFETKPEVDIHEMSPVALAFVGDAVLELLVRARLVGTTVLEYRASTGLECLLGWLYLRGENDRIQQLFDAVWAEYEPERK